MDKTKIEFIEKNFPNATLIAQGNNTYHVIVRNEQAESLVKGIASIVQNTKCSTDSAPPLGLS